MEKGEGIELAHFYEIDSYPTLLFINFNEDIVLRAKGVRSFEKLLKEANLALSK